ncbi:alpha/beta hydrolase [Jiangella ureilytica]|uniref:Alpha/beta hydrolase n=1 Tax=Jiangella ureilytica TaxID=2530374 RepID=A0A4R4RK62_9ACTN|nr:alpha/beta hydrolase [Jiangella ureilytica]TDC50008.1 alpha/beta hydrolase [Jiangella ureilytica]
MLRLSSIETSRGNALSVATVSPTGLAGNRSAVLLVHPINMRKECWLGLLPALAAERTCVLVDLAGHGESTDDDFSIEAWVADCVDLVEQLGLSDLHVVGGSLGGAIAIGLAAALPDRIRSITGLGSAVAGDAAERGNSPAPADADAVDALFAGLAREAVAPGRPADVVGTVRLLTNRHGADVVTRVLRAAYTADATGWMPAVRCPALWATGEHDVTCSLAQSERIAERLSGRHVALPGVGHLPMIEDPGLVLEHLLPHLHAADARPASA